jgi:leucyl aminopeptidase
LLAERSPHAIPIIPVDENNLQPWCAQQTRAWQRWLASTGFTGKPGSFCLLPDDQQNLAAVVAGVGQTLDPWVLAGLPEKLPAGSYFIDAGWSRADQELAALGWALACYRFSRYKENPPAGTALALTNADLPAVLNQAAAIALVRDLINTAAEDMMPEQLAVAAQTLGREFNAEVKQVIGEELLSRNYPTIHTVGRASVHAPRLIELNWGTANRHHPQLTLVGKGVCFDSGGLDLKPASGMRLMKKDMGGAAHALGLARMIMGSGLPVRLRVLIAAVENAVSGNAFRPGDVIRSRKGLTIEIDNTDAEGRLILCDALTDGAAANPDLMIDFATLTGAARVAMGPEVPAFFSNDDDVALELMTAAKAEHDPIWRLPLHKPYRQMLDSKVADIVNSASTPFAGSITAALFLQEFVPDHIPWVHFDLMAWNIRSQPGRPEGGEAMGLRAVFHYLQQRFAHSL